MGENDMNIIVARELSEVLARCRQQGVDATTVRTGLLTITIANFVNGIGLENSVALFSVLPDQIQSGLFNKFINPSQPAVAASGVRSPERMPTPPITPDAQPFPDRPAVKKEYTRRRL